MLEAFLDWFVFYAALLAMSMPVVVNPQHTFLCCGEVGGRLELHRGLLEI